MKAAKLAIIVLAPIVLVAGLIWSFSGSSGGLPTEVWVDISTGEVVPEPKGMKTIPMPNASGERMLFPMARQDGQLVVPGAYRGTIREIAQSNPDIKVDLETFTIKKP